MNLLKLLAGAVSLIGSIWSWFTGAQQRKVGQQEQRLADTSAEVKTLERERDAAEQAGSAEDAARRGKF